MHMVTRHERSGLVWVDLESPTREELAAVMTEFHVDERVEEEIITPTPYPLVAVAPAYVYLILHFPTTDPRGGARSQEIDIIVGSDFLITVRYELVSTIHTLHRIFESETLLGGKSRSSSPAELLERILRQLYAAITDQVGLVARNLDRIEEDIFNGREREMVRAISLVGRVLLRFDITLSRHEDSLREFLNELCDPRFFGPSFRQRIARIEAERAHAASIVASYWRMMVELRRTNDSLLSTSQTEVMKRLTIMSFVVFPLSLIAGIFGMNTEYLPFVGQPGDFWYIIGIMSSLTLCFFIFFKRMRWL